MNIYFLIMSSIRILDKAGKGEIEKLEPALEWCCQNNMRLINLSLGTTHFREHDRLNTLINKYTSKGLIIVAATSNIGFCTYPASFANVIGVATIGNPLQYCSDFVHLGIDTVVPSEHTVSLYDTEFKTPESILYRFEYIPDIQIPLTNQIIKDFIVGQIHYKQSDLILWSVTKEQKLKLCGIYPDYDIEIIFNKAEILVYIERNLIYKQTYDMMVYKYIMAIYSIIKNCLTEDEYE